MPDYHYYFPIVLFQKQDKVRARTLADHNICVLCDTEREAYFMIRHELYHYARKENFNFERHRFSSIFDIEESEGSLTCLVDINLKNYRKKAKKFRRKSGLISTLTFERKPSYELISLYKKQYLYPLRVKKTKQGLSFRFVDLDIQGTANNEYELMQIARRELFLFLRGSWKNKKVFPKASSVFELALAPGERILLIDVDLHEYRKRGR